MMRKKMEETDAPTLQTDCFTLRRLQSEDAEALHRISNEPLVRRYLWDDEPVSRAAIEAVIARSIRAFSKGRVGLFGVRWRGGKDLLGFCGFVRVESMACT